ncbi:hypothetical protein SCHPADRAFT_936357 [Schizopora paradoxa]|uniref:Inactive metallocarboxypeptidase ECM14 n=1 Tax=Schizopora paradoxa TaxID=27342 RepID=A0A0H2S993_9AGAM|nr:hypothetical protein SCHPADRAFT_936357 [Schizopora paradoxa]
MMGTTALQLLSVLFTVSAFPLEQEAELIQHALGLSKPSLRPDRTAQSVHSRYRFEADALEEVIGFVERNNFDVWQLTPSYVDLHTQQVEIPKLPDFLSPEQVSITYEDDQRLFPDDIEPYRRLQATESFPPLTNSTFHDNYRPLDEIDVFIKDLASSQFPHASTSLVELGHSAEGREMYGLKIVSADTGFKKTEKKSFVISGAQHAREWIATATTLYLAHAIVTDPSSPDSLAHLLDDFDVHIIPLPNPDGYLYTWAPEGDRFWYKNRMTLAPNERCQGVDMNRNWGYMWSPLSSFSGLTGGPTDPCSPLFPGHRPFEAPEVNNIANYIIQQVGNKAIAFLELRSYGQMISAPYSHSCTVMPPNAEDLLEAALNIAHAVKKKHGTSYTTGNLCSNLYAAPGNMLDWVYGEAHVPYAYSVHLGDTGTYGYTLPPRFIHPMGREATTMIRSLAEFVIKHPAKFVL